MGSSTVILEAKHISKNFFESSGTVLSVLEDSSFKVYDKEIVSVVGPSGSGKSTLLQICGLLDSPTTGDIIVNGITTTKLNSYRLAKIRKFNLGFIYQSHHLFPEFTSLENVMIPLLIRNVPKNIAKSKAKDLLIKVGLINKIDQKPSSLSGGEKQRVAIARALITNPLLVLADEPTGNLDSANKENILQLFITMIKNSHSSLLMVTHDMELTKYSNKIITIKDKHITEID